jgi:predicted nucleic acid-binding protein
MLIDPLSELSFPRDQKDAKFLACALSANADYVITGDKDFTEDRLVINTIIISAREFHQKFC